MASVRTAALVAGPSRNALDLQQPTLSFGRTSFMKNPSILSASIAALSAIGLNCADASTTGVSLSVNFGSDQAALAPTDVTGVVPSANWNNAPGVTGSLSNLTVDSSGNPVTLTGSAVTWAGSGVWSTNQESNTSQFTNPADEAMMTGYLDVFQGAPGSILFSGIPNGLYDIYVYSLTAVDGRDSGNVIVNGVQEKSISMFSTSFVEGGGPGGAQDAGGVPGNYNFYPNIAVADGQVNINLPGDTFRAAVNGVEIVQVPEPSSLALAAISSIGVLGLRRRRS